MSHAGKFASGNRWNDKNCSVFDVVTPVRSLKERQRYPVIIPEPERRCTLEQHPLHVDPVQEWRQYLKSLADEKEREAERQREREAVIKLQAILRGRRCREHLLPQRDLGSIKLYFESALRAVDMLKVRVPATKLNLQAALPNKTAKETAVRRRLKDTDSDALSWRANSARNQAFGSTYRSDHAISDCGNGSNNSDGYQDSNPTESGFGSFGTKRSCTATADTDLSNFTREVLVNCDQRVSAHFEALGLTEDQARSAMEPPFAMPVHSSTACPCSIY
jgi:hypothetical protein